MNAPWQELFIWGFESVIALSVPRQNYCVCVCPCTGSSIHLYGAVVMWLIFVYHCCKSQHNISLWAHKNCTAKLYLEVYCALLTHGTSPYQMSAYLELKVLHYSFICLRRDKKDSSYILGFVLKVDINETFLTSEIIFEVFFLVYLLRTFSCSLIVHQAIYFD